MHVRSKQMKNILPEIFMVIVSVRLEAKHETVNSSLSFS